MRRAEPSARLEPLHLKVVSMYDLVSAAAWKLSETHVRKSLETLGRAAPSVYGEIKSFFAAPVFFILLGCLFLIITARSIDQTHPSFIFLLAILGVSIVLYGTGTQGVGSAEFKNVPIKVAIAGGAGVLATVIGFGVLWQVEKVQKVFNTVHKMGLVELQNTTAPYFDLRTLHISARTPDGTQLPLLASEKSVYVFVPIAVGRRRDSICVTIASTTGTPLSPQGACSAVVWRRDSENIFGEAISDVGSGLLLLVTREPDFVPE
jgi:hypothetical protein